MKITCPQCGRKSDKAPSAVNRARQIGAPLYCGRRCAGLARRGPPKTLRQKRAEKAAYDAAYRIKNRTMLKAKKAAYHQRTRDPIKEAAYRKTNMARHVAYCQRPEYRRWKREYDRQHRAKKFGPFAEAYMLALDLTREINSRESDYDTRILTGTLNKRQQRKRDYERLIGNRA